MVPLNAKFRVPVHDLSPSNAGGAVAPKSSIDVLEWTKRRMNESYTQINFSLVDLLHAVVLTDVLVPQMNAHFLSRIVAAMYELQYLLEDPKSGGDFRFESSLRLRLNDFVSTSIVGRVAQGLSVLVMASKGYDYLAPFKTLAPPSSVAKTPDFVFASLGSSLPCTLMEAKGSEFGWLQASISANGLARKRLNKAFAQLGPTSTNAFTPPVSVAAVAALIAYGGGPLPVANTEIFFCDPPGEEGPKPLESHDVMHHHLELWRSLMFARNSLDSEGLYSDMAADFFGEMHRELELRSYFINEASGEIRMFTFGMHKALLSRLNSVAEAAVPANIQEAVQNDMEDIRARATNWRFPISVRRDGTVLLVQ